MGITFNAEEILDIAEQIERNGANFYRKAAENVAEEEHRNILTGLEATEDEIESARMHFDAQPVSFSAVRDYLYQRREQINAQ